MTKRELIELLKDCSDDTVILVHGHSDSGDYNDCDDVELIKVKAYKSYYWPGKYLADVAYQVVVAKLALIGKDASEYLHPDTIEAVVIH